jgi:hypothetical protein
VIEAFELPDDDLAEDGDDEKVRATGHESTGSAPLS